MSDEHPATALLLGSPPAAARGDNASSSSSSANNNMRRASSSASGSGGSGASPASPTGVVEAVLPPAGDTGAAAGSGAKLSPQQEFDASLDHAVDVMLTEVRPQLGQHNRALTRDTRGLRAVLPFALPCCVWWITVLPVSTLLVSRCAQHTLMFRWPHAVVVCCRCMLLVR